MTCPYHVRRYVPRIGLFIGFVLMTACTVTPSQRTAITEFGETTASFGHIATSEFQHMRDAVVTMNVRRLALEGAEASSGPLDLDEQFDPDVVKIRVESARLLQVYGRMLVALSSGADNADIQDAANTFLARLRNLSVPSLGMTENQLGPLGKIVEGIGQEVVETQRYDALRQVVNQTREVVQSLCDLFIRDFDPSAGGLATQYLNTTERLLPIARIEFFEGHTVSHRTAALEAYQYAVESRERRRSVIQPIFQAARELKHQHEEMVTTLNMKGLTPERLKDLRTRIQQFKRSIQELRESAEQRDLRVFGRMG